MTPSERYQADLKQPGFAYDPVQAATIKYLQQSYLSLVSPKPLLPLFRKTEEHKSSLYLWGGVGRGKTYLMDCYYEELPTGRKHRTHFYRFMKMIHQGLAEAQGKKYPLRSVANDIASRIDVLCLDEFFVTDIGDAMILAGLLDQLFKKNVALMTTSNVEPGDLYRDGLQRSRFLPAIDMIYQHMEIVCMDGANDHRLRPLTKTQLYHCPDDQAAEQAMENSFLAAAAPQPVKSGVKLEVEHRQISARYLSEDIVWFDFENLCSGPRSPNDYVELANRFHTVYISHIPQMGGNIQVQQAARGAEDTVDINHTIAERPLMRAVNDDEARRFISLVDEFYDRNIILVISSPAPITELYQGGHVAFEFERTVSRLLEMQSLAYVDREHRQPSELPPA